MAYGIVNVPGGSDVAAHIRNTENPHAVTKAQIGLGNVDNTSDADKPVSTAVQNALNGKQDKLSFVSNTNLLSNWYFADPINQRGKTEYTGGHTIDRWFAENGDIVVRVEEDCISITNSGSSDIGIKQILDFAHNGPVTLSILVKEGSGKIFISNNAAVDVSGPGLYFVTITNGSTIKSEGFYIRPTIGGYIKPIAVKLECGTQQTLAHQDGSGNWVLNDPPPNKALELLKCQRYQIELSEYSTDHGILGMGASAATETTKVFIFCPLPVTMRTKPSVEWSGSLKVIHNAGSFEEVEITDIEVNHINTNGVTLCCTTATPVVPATFYMLWRTSDVNSHILLNANL